MAIFLNSNHNRQASCSLSLRLFPSLICFSFILLHILFILIVFASLFVAISPPTSTKVLTWSPQSSPASSRDPSLSRCFPNCIVILKLACILSVLNFFLEWVVTALSFLLMYHAFVDRSISGAAMSVSFRSRIRKHHPNQSNLPKSKFNPKRSKSKFIQNIHSIRIQSELLWIGFDIQVGIGQIFFN